MCFQKWDLVSAGTSTLWAVSVVQMKMLLGTWLSKEHSANCMSHVTRKPTKRHSPSLIRIFDVHMKKAWAHWAHSEDWSSARSDQSLRWAHRLFCWFCHEAAHIILYVLLHPGSCFCIDYHKAVCLVMASPCDESFQLFCILFSVCKALGSSLSMYMHVENNKDINNLHTVTSLLHHSCDWWAALRLGIKRRLEFVLGV